MGQIGAGEMDGWPYPFIHTAGVEPATALSGSHRRVWEYDHSSRRA